MALQVRICPGCGLEMPLSTRQYDRKFNASAECWSLFEEVLASEFENALLFGQVHQLTVDSYTVQHAGGRHPDKSVAIHLVGLYLAMERGVASTKIPPILQRLANRSYWPHLELPQESAALTVYDIALADSPQVYVQRVREWAAQVWSTWRPHHNLVRELAEEIIASA